MASRPSARRIFRTTTRAMTRVYRSTFLLLFTALTFASTAAGQTIEPRADGTPVVLTLDEAVQIALVQNHVLRSTALDLETADAQIREAWGQLLPQVDISSSYTRNVVTANLFAGSEAGGLFASFGFVDWLAYNEQARMDDDPSTEPLPLDEFMDRPGREWRRSARPWVIPVTRSAWKISLYRGYRSTRPFSMDRPLRRSGVRVSSARSTSARLIVSSSCWSTGCGRRSISPFCPTSKRV